MPSPIPEGTRRTVSSSTTYQKAVSYNSACRGRFPPPTGLCRDANDRFVTHYMQQKRLLWKGFQQRRRSCRDKKPMTLSRPLSMPNVTCSAIKPAPLRYTRIANQIRKSSSRCGTALVRYHCTHPMYNFMFDVCFPFFVSCVLCAIDCQSSARTPAVDSRGRRSLSPLPPPKQPACWNHCGIFSNGQSFLN